MSKRVVGVRFRNAGRVYYFDPKEFEISSEDGLIVETSYGTEYGDVAFTPREVSEEQIVAPLKEVLRIATEDDRVTNERNRELEQEALPICQQKIAEHKLDMKLVDVEYSFNGSKITFYFTADGRIDFRELVKDLASVFKTRIELRQIGVRDEAKMLGGLGSCGRSICCKTFLTDFQPVSIKMAKEQNLSLSPTKISGLCGRLMCCLKYEQDSYECMRRLMPRIGRDVITPDGTGLVLDNNAITERTRVRLTLSDGTVDVREYHFSDIRRTNMGSSGDNIEVPDVSSYVHETDAVPDEEEFFFVTGEPHKKSPPPSEAPTEHPSVDKPLLAKKPRGHVRRDKDRSGPRRQNEEKPQPQNKRGHKRGPDYRGEKTE